jgi:hypothetical protein
LKTRIAQVLTRTNNAPRNFQYCYNVGVSKWHDVSINHKKIAVVIGITYIGDTPKFIVEIIYATILEQVVGSSYGSGICGLILFACRIEATIGSSGRSTQGTVSSPIRLVESPSNTERVGGSFRSKLI